MAVASILGYGQYSLQQNQLYSAELAASTSRNQALAALIIALGDENYKTRTLAAVGLVQFGQDAVRPLNLAIGDDNEDTRDSVVTALAHIYNFHDGQDPDESAVRQLVLDEAGRNFLEGNNNAVEASVRLLIRIKQLVSLLKSDGIITTKAIKFNVVIDILEENQQIDYLAEIVSYSELPIHRKIYVISAVGNLIPRKGVPALNKLINIGKDATEDSLQQTVIREIDANIGKFTDISDETVEKIKRIFLFFLEKESDGVRASAVLAIKQFCDDAKVKNALRRIAVDRNPEMFVSNRSAKEALEEEQCGKSRAPGGNEL